MSAGGVPGEGGGGDNGGVTGWRASLGDLGNSPSLAVFKDEDLVPMPRAVARSFVETKALVGADTIAKPNDKWTDEQWGKLYDDLGRPKAPEEYKLSEIKLPDGLGVDDALKGHMLKLAHGAGLSNRQFDAMWKGYLERQVSDFQTWQTEEKKASDAWVAEQKSRLGGAYDATLDLANRALAAAGAGPESELLGKLQGLTFSDGTPLLRHPAFLDVFGALGKKLSEGNLLPGEKAGTGYGRTKEQAAAELEEYKAKNAAHIASDDPQYKPIRQRYEELLREKLRLEGVNPT